MVTRREGFLKEMGIAPLWKKKHGPTTSIDETPSVESGLLLSNDDSSAVAETPAGSRPIAEMNWDELEAAVAGCTRCGLCRDRTRTVFGIGDRQAQWLFIGEGPGYYEDKQGEPFVGRSGMLLDNMLAALGLRRGANAYIANVVKCRATDAQGKDRPPTPQEIATCLPYLKRQIDLLQPAQMLALGKTAALALLDMEPSTPVGQLRGQIYRYRQIPLVVTYHPAYLLRQPKEKRKAWSDLCVAAVSHAQPNAE